MALTPMADSFNPYYTWLGIPPEEQPADHYRLLAIRPFESNEEVIINAADQRMAFVRTFQTGKRAKESQRLLNEIAAAQSCLLHPRKKLAYDEELRHTFANSEPLPPAPTSPQAPRSAPRILDPALLIAAALRSRHTPQEPSSLRLLALRRPSHRAIHFTAFRRSSADQP